MCKSRFVFFMLAAMVVCCVLPAQFVSAQAPLGTNLASTVYYSTGLPFKNVGRMMDIRDESGRDRIYMMWDIEGHFPLGDYVILYDGSGSIDSFSGGTVVEQTAGRIVISKSAGQGLSFLRGQRNQQRSSINIYILYDSRIQRLRTGSGCHERFDTSADKQHNNTLRTDGPARTARSGEQSEPGQHYNRC